MYPQTMEPFGAALLAYFQGQTGAELIIRRDDGYEAPLPVRHLLRV
jgi:hypothetical protein